MTKFRSTIKKKGHDKIQKGKIDASFAFNEVTSILLVFLESIVSFITYLLPSWFISICTSIVKFIFQNPYIIGLSSKSKDPMYENYIKDKIDTELLKKIENLRVAKSFKEMCNIFDVKVENHLVQTSDSNPYCLTLHRLDPKLNGFKPNGKIVYLQHGLLMSSEIWITMYQKEFNLPFVLMELGYEVWLGNNRGNKYSCKNVNIGIKDKKFWDFSIDEFAMYDIPNSIDYILNFTKIKSLTYIGFSQGCSQILASVSLNSSLNEKIEKLILISPATTPKGLSNKIIDTMMSWSPKLMFLVFGRKILLKSANFWKNIIYPPFFVKIIDSGNNMLFNWKSENIDATQKFISYFHLYSATSVKCVVHWFQIMKAKKFQMYNELTQIGEFGGGGESFNVFEFDTRNRIKIPNILLIYGKSDSLVDVEVLMNQLPNFTTDVVDIQYKENDDYYIRNNLEENEPLSSFKDTSSVSPPVPSNSNIIRKRMYSFSNDSSDFNDKLLKTINEDSINETYTNDNDEMTQFGPETSILKDETSTINSNDSTKRTEYMDVQNPNANYNDNNKIKIIGVEKYEHLDLIWGENINEIVFKNIKDFLN